MWHKCAELTLESCLIVCHNPKDIITQFLNDQQGNFHLSENRGVLMLLISTETRGLKVNAPLSLPMQVTSCRNIVLCPIVVWLSDPQALWDWLKPPSFDTLTFAGLVIHLPQFTANADLIRLHCFSMSCVPSDRDNIERYPLALRGRLFLWCFSQF